jgi:flagellar assembly protein FliH
MACKIADDPATIEPVMWTPISAAHSLRKAYPAARLPQPSEEVPHRARSAEAERIREAELAQARQAGFEEGVRKAREEAFIETKNANDRLANTLKDLLVLKRRMRSEAESDVVKLSLAVARRILHRELSSDPESIQGVVYAGLQKLQNREISSVRVCPGAVEAVRAALEKAGVFPATSVISDPKLRNGDVVFETAFGELDASVETQLQEIERGFADRLGLSC